LIAKDAVGASLAFVVDRKKEEALMRWRLFSILGLFALGACAAPADGADDAADDDEEDVATTEQELIGGDPARRGQFDATLYFYGCTAARVGPRHILTAARCVADPYTGKTYPWLAAGTQVNITSSRVLDEKASWPLVTLSALHVHPAWTRSAAPGGPFALGAAAPHPPDMAVVVTKEILPRSIGIASIDTGRVADNAEVTVTGYGCETRPDDPKPGPLRLKVESTRTQSMGERPHDARYIATPSQRQKRTEASLCYGDDGGPLYRGDGGRVQRVIGVNAAAWSRDDPSASWRNTHARMSREPYFFGRERLPGVVEWLWRILPRRNFVD
jgi:trypsin